jgi:hypothetical protein
MKFTRKNGFIVTLGAFAALAFVVAPVVSASSAVAASLPAGLFVKKAPEKAVGVGDARKNAKQGKPIVVKGIIGGAHKPIVDNYAVFLLTDSGLPRCKDGCIDFCEIPKEKLMQNMATIQVADESGRPLKASIAGINGLKPLSKVVVAGTVAVRSDKILIINAKRIFVDGGK